MRIAYLHQYFVTPEMAGGGRSYEIGRRLAAAGHEVHMITSDRTGEGKAAGWRESETAGMRVHWTTVPYANAMGYRDRMRAFGRFAWRAARRAAALKPDLVYATSTPLTIALPGAYSAFRSRAPMVFEVRDLWPAVPIAVGALRNPLARWAAIGLERFAYRSAAHVIALAPGMRDAIVATGYPAERVSVIPNGCDLEIFSDLTAGERIRREHDWVGPRPLLVFTGTFGLVNGMDYLVDLAANVARIDPEIRIVAVGSGREWQRTRQAAMEMGILDRSFFLPGELPRSEAAAWTIASNMTISLFSGPEVVWRDSVQNKFFDSLAAGRPVASNFPGWQAKVAEEAGAGLTLSAKDPHAAAVQVVRALRDDEWLAAAGGAARRLAEQRFNRNQQAAEVLGILEKVLEGW